MTMAGKMKTAVRVLRTKGVAGVWDVLRVKLARTLDPPRPEVDISTDYTHWLRCANAGMLSVGNLYCMDYAMRNLPDESPMLEIGSWCGLSANVISYFRMKHGIRNRFITCDKWEYERYKDKGFLGDNETITHNEYRQFVKDAYLRNVRFFSRKDLPFTVEATSDDFFRAWENAQKATDVFGRDIQLGGSLSFCYVDGNHTYEFARRDFENCDRFLSAGGFILFDDSVDGSEWEVCKVVQEVLASGRYEFVIKNPNYMVKKIAHASTSPLGRPMQVSRGAGSSLPR